MKPKPPALKQFGQTSLPSSFLSKSNSSTPDEVAAAGTKTNKKQPISLSDFLSRKLGKTDRKTVQEKQSSFSSIGLGKKDESGGGDVLDTAVFRGFKRPAEEETGDAGSGVGEEELRSASSTWVCRDPRKRKNPFGVYSGDLERPSASESSVVGNGLKPIVPQPKRRAKKPTVERARPFYNHYESGSGWWDCDREGVDSEEVGCNEVWEGMGSTTLGGLEWH